MSGRVLALPLGTGLRLAVLLGGLFYMPALVAQTEINEIDSGQYLLQVVFGLALVVLLIFALAWGLKWVNRLNGATRQQSIKIVSQSPLGIKEKLVVVEVANKHLLLGLTPTNISLLHRFEEGEFTDAEPAKDTSSTNPGENFSHMFKKITGRD